MIPAIPTPDVVAQATALVRARVDTVLSVRAADAATAQWLVDEGHRLRSMKDALQAEVDRVAKPARKIANDHAARYRPAIKAIEGALAYCRSEPLAYQQRARAEQAKALESAAATGAGPEEIQRAAAVCTPVPEGLTERESWEIEIVDRAAIPDNYFVLDEARLLREARALKERFAVPGVRARRVTTGVLR